MPRSAQDAASIDPEIRLSEFGAPKNHCFCRSAIAPEPVGGLRRDRWSFP